ncbi:MAG: metallophosphoesterase family protein [Tepidisphaerales bacterium]
MTNMRITRRRLMQVSAGVLLSAELWPGALAAGDAPAADFDFVAVNDLHYWDQGCNPFFEKMVAKMKEASPKSKLLLVCGDLAEHGKAEQLTAMRDLLKPADMEVHTVCGNHDWARDDDRKAFEEIWPGSLNYTFEHNGWQIVALDTTDGTKSSVEIRKPAFEWLDQNMPKLDRKRPMILVTHFPMGVFTPMRPKNADDLLDRFRDFNLRAVFCGHYHGFTERSRGNATITTGKCCSFRRDNHDRTKEKGFFACKARDGKVAREFVEVRL